MKPKHFLLSAVASLGTVVANTAQAVCPVCVVAVGAGVGLCRWLGVDDTISGLWIGALIVAAIMWTLIWLDKKQRNFKYSQIIVSAACYILIILPLYSFNIMGHPLNKVFGIDKLLFGIIFGSVVFLLSHYANLFLKNKNQGKVYFPYQKVAVPLVFLIITSVIFYFIIKCY